MAKETEPTEVLLARIDERLQNVEAKLGEMKDGFVTKSEFMPIKLLVYGGTGTALLALLTMLLKESGIS